MIIQCPACATRYVVPDTAIGAEGRTVRCAKCRHSWYQDGPELELTETAPPPAPTPAPAPAPTPAPTSRPASPQRQSPAPPRQSPPPPMAVAAGPVPAPPPPLAPERTAPIERVEIPPPPTVRRSAAEDVASHFDREPPFRPRRNWLKLLTWAGAIFALVALGTIGAVSYWGLPDWVPVERPTFGVADPDLQLDFPPELQERRTLPNGTEYFGANGTITNIGTVTRTIPSILIVLRGSRDRIVYTSEVAPPQRTLAPGENVAVREAVTDIPRDAREVQFGWKPE
ncbi:thioredoxin [Erythrobacter arachoides]|uniref:Thioredoxin n=1 Tax=Aurantiacibacter arachoides TaxID=1850444 RepID=A0A845A1K4_9SPHN|nr:zinc-ribbon domain-containing protein [Aurantiacibacter arachoides]MXO94423.1 thioredoxin [Aurantiacibacter arachoides]GGD63531.1 hypothetical protein GCM10011411_24850 [Aurantiacibacter arachoides]